MDYMSKSQCIKAATIDAPSMSTDVGKYISLNSFQYYLVCNTWIAMVRHYNRSGAIFLTDAIMSQGLIDCIKLAQADAEKLLHDSAEPLSFAPLLCDCEITKAEVLQVLRYPKRFSPLNADKLEADAFSDLLRINNNIKMHDRRGYSQYILKWVKPIVYDLCKDFEFDASRGYFSSGAVNDTKKAKIAKFLAWEDPFFLSPMYPIGNLYPDYRYDPDHAVRIAEAKAVPKNYKTPRIIAEESAYRQWHLLALKCCLEDSIKHSKYGDQFDPKDQDTNRRLCYEASLHGKYATVDYSRASDSIACTLGRELFPEKVRKAFDEYRATKIRINGKDHTCYILATSGAGNCFDQEGVMFLGIAEGATEFVQLFTDEVLLKPYVYGDDTIVDCRVYPTLLEFMAALGFSVNADKSFSEGGYREACGVEFMDGHEMTSIYFPRTPVCDTAEGIQSLIELHNAFWPNYPYLTAFLRSVVRNQCDKHGWVYSTTSTEDFLTIGQNSDLLYHKTQGVREVRDPSYADPLAYDTTVLEHMAFSTRNVKKSKLPKGPDLHYADMYYYVMYLIHGPQYDSRVDEILHVSTSRVDPDDWYSEKELVIKGDKGGYER